MNRRFVVVPGAIVAALAVLVTVALMVGRSEAAFDPDKELFATMTAVAVKAPERAKFIDSTFLAEFNSGKRDYWTLRRGELAAGIAPPYDRRTAWAESDTVVLAKIESVWFFTSNTADIPLGIWRVRVTESFKGDHQRGDVIDYGIAGGPVPAPYEGVSDSMVVFPLGHIARPGQELLFFFTSDIAPGSYPTTYQLAHPFNYYLLDDGKVVDEPLAQGAGLAGMDRQALVEVVRELARTE